MNAASLDRIRRSYRQLTPMMAKLTELFYDRLFTSLPESRKLFRTDMEIQRRHFAAALALIVRNLDKLDALEEPLRELGKDHARAGVRAEHYPVVCEVILASIAEVSRDAWSDEVSGDWQNLLHIVSLHMLAGSITSPV